jgi:hypothetical protein
MHRFDRRAVTAGLASAAFLRPDLAAAFAPRPHIEGVTTWSESVMVLYFDADLRNGLSLRLSRYPDLGTTWVWCHVICDGMLYSYTNHDLPCAADHKRADDTLATYEVPGLQVRMTRSGTSADMTALSFSAQVAAHRGGKGVDGRGNIPVQLDGIFHPGPLRAGSPAGRFERTGHVEAELAVRGRAVSLSGVAKAHEQTQTAPRFDAPFTYAMLWGPDASLTGLLSATRRYGDYDGPGGDRAITNFAAEASAPTRRFEAQLDDGSHIAGTARTAFSFDVPVFSRQWHGHVVAGAIEGHPVVGMINDWRPELQPYGLGRKA